MNKWISGKIIQNKKWTESLFSIIVQAPINAFLSGQFTKLAMIDIHGKKIQRAYSYVNASHNTNLEFYITLVQTGLLTNYLYKKKINDSIIINQNSFGFFTINEIQHCEILWMIATGTGIGPYLSILQEEKWIHKFYKIVLIHSVRYKHDLIYLPVIHKLQKKYKNRIILETIVTRDTSKQFLHDRIPTLINNHTLEKKIKLDINIHTSHVMLCGNPNMIKETQFLLQEKRHLTKNLRKKPGHITTENYW
ncbi:Flavodoxin/ferredoxin--NADP reductase [Buchnera aphidicola (Eriosoma lanigerum)]|uniref:FAD-binding oxidoreductase n=1 Tax=Buchnera aphidicola TaxID=9 RepID=UPI0034642EFD